MEQMMDNVVILVCLRPDLNHLVVPQFCQVAATCQSGEVEARRQVVLEVVVLLQMKRKITFVSNTQQGVGMKKKLLWNF